jgi:hypothetical protein
MIDEKRELTNNSDSKNDLFKEKNGNSEHNKMDINKVKLLAEWSSVVTALSTALMAIATIVLVIYAIKNYSKLDFVPSLRDGC